MEDLAKIAEQYDQFGEHEDKSFDKDAWLKKLAVEINSQSYIDGFRDKSIYIEDLILILQHYFPQFKLTDYDRTPTNTANNTSKLAPDTTTTIRQSQDEDITGASTTNLQVVSS